MKIKFQFFIASLKNIHTFSVITTRQKKLHVERTSIFLEGMRVLFFLLVSLTLVFFFSQMKLETKRKRKRNLRAKKIKNGKLEKGRRKLKGESDKKKEKKSALVRIKQRQFGKVTLFGNRRSACMLRLSPFSFFRLELNTIREHAER